MNRVEKLPIVLLSKCHEHAVEEVQPNKLYWGNWKSMHKHVSAPFQHRAQNSRKMKQRLKSKIRSYRTPETSRGSFLILLLANIFE